ncbi:MAG: hypothetical protein HOP10_06460 [Chitinophagaceae bacterium]|nr:hypothetical protein [Chitinophagaceae bacterium]
MSLISVINIKRLKLTTILLLSPLFFFAQTLTGLWSGAMSNDSTTVRKDQSFEIALTEYKGKVYGYSCSEFIVDDELFYIVKRVKGTIEGDVCEVTDDEIIAYNFKGKLDKKVKVTSTFRRNGSDSAWYLEGTWKTNVTKKYYAVTGKVGLKEEKDMAVSKLFPHLEELNLTNDVAFYKEQKETPVIVKIAKPEKIKPEYTDGPPSLSVNNDVAIVPAQPIIQKADTDQPIVSINKQGDELPKSGTKNIPSSSIILAPSSVNKTIAEAELSMVSVKKQDVDMIKPDTKKISSSSVNLTPSSVNKIIAETELSSVSIKKQDNDAVRTDAKNISSSSVNVAPSSVNKTVAETKKPPVTTNPSTTNTTAVNKPVNNKNEVRPNNPVVSAPATKTIVKQDQPTVKTQPTTKPETKTAVGNDPVTKPETVAVMKNPVERKSEADLLKPAAVIEGRKSEFSQVVNFKSDSLVLSLYDNGEIDGDTVSVFMNGEVIMAKQGLKSKAIKKTIYITRGNEDFTLVLFADNLGKYPPNTGLLVVHDGDDVYNLRFSSDMQKSSGIVFRKKE